MIEQEMGEIISIEPVQCDDDFVYNLEVESSDTANKNYFADGMLVSNCHRMSPAAEEALLKLLEEPPSKVRFVLCTTELQQMRGTILSRCQVHEFKKIFWREISSNLEHISKFEEIDIDVEALNLCAKLANGSMRDGLQNLEKVAHFNGKGHIDISIAQKVFGSVSDLLFYNLIDEICKDGIPDATKGYQLINELLISGMGESQVFDGISEVLRNNLIGVSATSCKGLITVSEEAKIRLKEQLRHFKPKIQALVSIMQSLVEARTAIQYGQTLDIALQTWFLHSILIFQKG